jgi:hypothetical protein
MTRITLASAALAVAALASPAVAQQAGQGMGFFVTSANPGKDGDLGGIAGADAYCHSLAQAAGAGNRTWRAYLSTQGAGAVNARDRIGRGPWRNAKGEVIAQSLADLQNGAPGLTKQTALTERGQVVNGRGDTPNMHDILTGSQADGTAFPEERGPHLPQLDQRRCRLRHARAQRPDRAERLAADEVLERLPPLARVQHGGAEGYRGRRAVLLLCGGLTPRMRGEGSPRTPFCFCKFAWGAAGTTSSA